MNVSTKKDDNIHGIGLSIVKTLVHEKLKGKINVSNTQQGARFVMKLPIQEKVKIKRQKTTTKNNSLIL